MTTLLTLNTQSKCIIPNDVKVICAQLQEGTLAYLVVNGEQKYDYWIYKDKMKYDTPLIVHKDDILEISSNNISTKANILVEII